ncbi:MAG: Cof-type HAD-IIB family hydrolase [Acidimicrobiales bacterium]
MSDAPIRLVISDVDGTLVTPDKVLTDEAILAVRQLRKHGIFFTITSSRPPRGLSMYVNPLDLSEPIGAFNGGLMVDRYMEPLHELTIKEELVEPIVASLTSNGLSVWVYQGTDWFVLDLNAPHVQHEAGVVQFEPTQLESFDGISKDVVKIVGVSDEPEVIAKATKSIDESFEKDVSATSSQTYYLDITHRRANKGAVVDYLADDLSIDRASIVTIGDAENDVSMFERAGISIAMGNATDDVKSRATHVSRANDDNGFAFAMEHFVLGPILGAAKD